MLARYESARVPVWVLAARYDLRPPGGEALGSQDDQRALVLYQLHANGRRRFWHLAALAREVRHPSQEATDTPAVGELLLETVGNGPPQWRSPSLMK